MRNIYNSRFFNEWWKYVGNVDTINSFSGFLYISHKGIFDRGTFELKTRSNNMNIYIWSPSEWIDPDRGGETKEFWKVIMMYAFNV